MAVKKAYAYDSLTGRWLPSRVPMSWFKTFPHLKHTGPDGERPPGPRHRIADLVSSGTAAKPKRARKPRVKRPPAKPEVAEVTAQPEPGTDPVLTEQQGDNAHEDAGGQEPQADLGDDDRGHLGPDDD